MSDTTFLNSPYNFNPMDRKILHIDLNCCFAQIECEQRPELRKKPVVVAGKEELRHGIVMAKNQVAKEMGISTASTLNDARCICPDVVVLPPNYELYKEVSRRAREIYYRYSDRVEPFGIDECWMDVTDSYECLGMSDTEIADDINRVIYEELGLTTSIGVSWNKIFAKFGSDYRKPDGVTAITRENYKEIIWKSPVRGLLYVGRATEEKLKEIGVYTIGELAQVSDIYLKSELGKMGIILRDFALGNDVSDIKVMDPKDMDVNREIKSYGNGITFPRDITDDATAKAVTHMLAESVVQRMRADGARANKVAVALRSGLDLGFITRQRKLTVPTNITTEFCKVAWSLVKSNWTFNRDNPVRAMQVRAGNIESEDEPLQLQLFDEYPKREELTSLDKTVDDMRRRWGNNTIMWGAKASDDVTADSDIIGWDKPHPVSFFHR